MVEVDLSMDFIATNGQMWFKTRGTLKMKILKNGEMDLEWNDGE